ncbi:mucin-5AC-like isoform X4 [Choloepus didactylus]|uniref:mucin-5AC-like isoform X4 n=1 Tax=Choloepus didactylus TaxID=27675 RepID=UPI0018A0CF22|nr:mucin-5AC-like isoform X4 [Choloepus didactylus]
MEVAWLLLPFLLLGCPGHPTTSVDLSQLPTRRAPFVSIGLLDTAPASSVRCLPQVCLGTLESTGDFEPADPGADFYGILKRPADIASYLGLFAIFIWSSVLAVRNVLGGARILEAKATAEEETVLRETAQLNTKAEQAKIVPSADEDLQKQFQAQLSSSVSATHKLQELKKLEEDCCLLRSENAAIEAQCKALAMRVQGLDEIIEQQRKAAEEEDRLKVSQQQHLRMLSEAEEQARRAEEDARICRQRMEELNQERQEAERSFKQQIMHHEKNAHDSWIRIRVLERALAGETKLSAFLKYRLNIMQSKKPQEQGGIETPVPVRSDVDNLPPRANSSPEACGAASIPAGHLWGVSRSGSCGGKRAPSFPKSAWHAAPHEGPSTPHAEIRASCSTLRASQTSRSTSMSSIGSCGGKRAPSFPKSAWHAAPHEGPSTPHAEIRASCSTLRASQTSRSTSMSSIGSCGGKRAPSFPKSAWHAAPHEGPSTPHAEIRASCSTLRASQTSRYTFMSSIGSCGGKRAPSFPKSAWHAAPHEGPSTPHAEIRASCSTLRASQTSRYTFMSSIGSCGGKRAPSFPKSAWHAAPHEGPSTPHAEIRASCSTLRASQTSRSTSMSSIGSCGGKRAPSFPKSAWHAAPHEGPSTPHAEIRASCSTLRASQTSRSTSMSSIGSCGGKRAPSFPKSAWHAAPHEGPSTPHAEIRASCSTLRASQTSRYTFMSSIGSCGGKRAPSFPKSAWHAAPHEGPSTPHAEIRASCSTLRASQTSRSTSMSSIGSCGGKRAPSFPKSAWHAAPHEGPSTHHAEIRASCSTLRASQTSRSTSMSSIGSCGGKRAPSFPKSAWHAAPHEGPSTPHAEIRASCSTLRASQTSRSTSMSSIGSCGGKRAPSFPKTAWHAAPHEGPSTPHAEIRASCSTLRASQTSRSTSMSSIGQLH